MHRCLDKIAPIRLRDAMPKVSDYVMIKPQATPAYGIATVAAFTRSGAEVKLASSKNQKLKSVIL
jgi:hypothetical protein